MRIAVIAVPYHLGREHVGLGNGPQALLDAGAARELEEAGHEVTVDVVQRSAPFRHEIGAALDVIRVVAQHVSAAVKRGALPIVLAGNCSSSSGTLAGIGSEDTSLFWFDAHADFNTPETTETGFFDGMTLTMAVGRCWTALAESIPRFRPLPEANAVLIGARDIDRFEAPLLQSSDVAAVSVAEVRAGRLADEVKRVRARTRRAYLHLDLDVLDTSVGRANEWAVPGGLMTEELLKATREIAQGLPLAAVALTAYNPAVDEQRGVERAALQVLSEIGSLLAQRQEPVARR